MRRVVEIDSLRGIAILVMLVFHSSYYWHSNFSIVDYNRQLQNPLAMAALVLGKFAGIFAIISSMAYTISISEKRRKLGSSYNSRHIFNQTTFAGFWVILLAKIHVTLFNHTHTGHVTDPYPTGPRYFTLITGSFQNSSIQFPSKDLFLYRNTALLLIGLSIILTGVLLSLLFKNEGHKKLRRNMITTTILGTIIILVTQVMKNTLRPLWVQAIVSNKVFTALFLGILIGDSFPFFPFAGYTLYGVVFGFIFTHNISRVKVNLLGGMAAIAYFITGLLLYIKTGPPSITVIQETPDAPLNFIQVSFMLFICVLIYNIHYLEEKSLLKRIFNTKSIRRFGLMTLTLFMLEPLLGTILKIIIFRGWLSSYFDSLIFSFIYGTSLVFLWHLILEYWEKYEFVGSWEWLNAKVLSYLTGVQRTRSKIIANLHFQ